MIPNYVETQFIPSQSLSVSGLGIIPLTSPCAGVAILKLQDNEFSTDPDYPLQLASQTLGLQDPPRILAYYTALILQIQDKNYVTHT